MLEGWKAQSTDTGLVFKNKDGQKFDNVATAWRNLLNAAQIESFRWHDLRHDFASRLAMAGIDLNTIREILGHKKIETTLKYAHLCPKHTLDAVQRLCVDESNVVHLDTKTANN